MAHALHLTACMDAHTCMACGLGAIQPASPVCPGCGGAWCRLANVADAARLRALAAFATRNQRRRQEDGWVVIGVVLGFFLGSAALLAYPDMTIGAFVLPVGAAVWLGFVGSIVGALKRLRPAPLMLRLMVAAVALILLTAAPGWLAGLH